MLLPYFIYVLGLEVMRRIPLIRNWSGVLLLVVVFFTGCSMGSTTSASIITPIIGEGDGDSGVLARYFYDDNYDATTPCFSAAVMIGVGTAMRVDDYGKLADAIVQELNHGAPTLFVILTRYLTIQSSCFPNRLLER